MKYNIEPVINPFYSCFEVLMATYASFQKRDCEMIFCDSWGFWYHKETFPFGAFLGAYSQKRSIILFEKFHGIKIMDEQYNNINDLINIIETKLSQSPIILCY